MGVEAEKAFPGLYKRWLTDSISWEFYKHWGQGYLAGEGRTEWKGDRSGCLFISQARECTSPPIVAQARLYESDRGQISAVYSYPHGIGLNDEYFWEIMPIAGEMEHEVERFSTEDAMEQRVKELLAVEPREKPGALPGDA